MRPINGQVRFENKEENERLKSEKRYNWKASHQQIEGATA